MNQSPGKYTDTFTLIVESEFGVQSILVGVLDHKPFNILRVIETTPLSGSVWQVSPQQLLKAMKMHVWSEENPKIFIDGRVTG